MLLPLLLAIDFNNFTYNKNPCPENVPVPAAMRNGDFSYIDRKTAVTFEVRVHSIKRGSLQPGTHQAVVVLACDFPMGGVASAYVFNERGKGATLLREVATTGWGADWGNGPDSIHVRFAPNRLYVDQCTDDECSMRKRTAYTMRHGNLAQVQSILHK